MTAVAYRSSALQTANRRRQEIAAVRASVPKQNTASRVYVAGLLREPSEAVRAMRLVHVLALVRKPGGGREAFVDSLLEAAGIFTDRRVGELSDRQRRVIAGRLVRGTRGGAA